MAVVVTTVLLIGALSRAKLQSNHHHQQINIQFFYRLDVLPVAQGPAYTKLTWGSSNFVFDH